MTFSGIDLPRLSQWTFGGDGTGTSRAAGPTDAIALEHESGAGVAIYCDIELPRCAERQLYLLKARMISSRRNAGAVAVYDGSNWYRSEGNLLQGKAEILGTRFRANGGDKIRVHVLASQRGRLTIESVLIEPVSETLFEPPSTFPALLTAKPGYMNEAEWQQFQTIFGVNPVEGARYLNNLEIKKSIQICYSWPEVLQFSLSLYCNIMCQFCSQTRFHETFERPDFAPDDLTIERLRLMFQDVEIGYPYHVDFSGDGEPIVHPNFVELLEFARAKFPFSNLRTCSNGLALTPDLSEKLIEHQLDWLNISLNAATAEAWEITTGSRHFDRVIENIRHLQQRKRALGARKPVIGMSYVLTRHSLECLPEFVDLCVELGVDSATVHHMTVTHAEFVNDSVIFTKRRANEILRAVRAKADRLGFQINLPTLFADIDDEAEPPAPAEFDFATRRHEYIAAWSKSPSEIILCFDRVFGA